MLLLRMERMHSYAHGTDDHVRAPHNSPAGTPHVEVGVGSVPIMVAAAVAMLAAGKPINVSRKEVGGWRLNLRMPRARSEYANATIQPAV